MITEAVNFSRHLIDEPGNSITPETLLENARNLSKDGVKVSTPNSSDLSKMGGLQAVGRGSEHKPQFIILELNPSRSKPVLLVGKAVTFDSGGISLKPWIGMSEMKNDMAGGAAVLGAMRSLARLGCKRHIVGLIPVVENMPDGRSYRPGDVIKIFDGQTVEIISTDAEGRLILADALAYGMKFNPEFTLDLATLTGAMVIALGNTFTGLFCNDEILREKVMKAAQKGRENVWPMPLHKDFTEDIKSQFADWKNSAFPRHGGACHGASFLQAFVKGPWAHLDIAGSTLFTKERNYFPKASTGVGVRLLTNLLLER